MNGTIKIVYTDDDNGEVVAHTYQVSDDTWPELTEKWFYFLRGCSFALVKQDFVQHFAELLEDWNSAEKEGDFKEVGDDGR